jgi:hypothetical protein
MTADKNTIAMVSTWSTGAPGTTQIMILTRSPFRSDSDNDNDVDGSDLAIFAQRIAAGTNTIAINRFAADFGMTR